jgi:hypothetical protein
MVARLAAESFFARHTEYVTAARIPAPEAWRVLIDTAHLIIEDTALLCERATATQEEARRLRIEGTD